MRNGTGIVIVSVIVSVLTFALPAFADGARVSDETLDRRYSALESKFLLLLESAAARKSEESELVARILAESRQRRIAEQLKTLEQTLKERRYADAAAQFARVESDLAAVESLFGEPEQDERGPETSGKSATGKSTSGENAAGENAAGKKNERPAKQQEDKDRRSRARKELLRQLLLQTRELHRSQAETHAILNDAKTETKAQWAQLADRQRVAGEKLSALHRAAETGGANAYLTTLFAGLVRDSQELESALKTGTDRDEIRTRSAMLLAGLAAVVVTLEQSLEDPKTNEEQETPVQDEETGANPDYMPSLDELLAIRQLQSRIVERFRYCQRQRREKPGAEPEVRRALEELAREQKRLAEMLQP